MKRSRLILFAIILCVFALPSFAQNKIDIFGYYSIEQAPKAFADISEIHLAGDYGAMQKPPMYGLIRLKKRSARDFRLLRPTLTGKNLTFKSKTVGGVHYEFSGRFTKLGNFPVTQPNGQVLLKGKLTKYRGKRIIATATLRFSYEAGD